MTSQEFSLWLEFEQWIDGRDPTDDFFNMQILLPDGRRYALNVWTYRFFARAVEEQRATESYPRSEYMAPPDLFVERLDRGLIETIVADMLADGKLKAEWLCPEQDDE
jgi:hypothetical protein